MDELISLVKREREKVRWHRKHLHAFNQRYDIEEKLYRAVGILKLKAEPKPKLDFPAQLTKDEK